jgi:molecular chaperone DnaK
VNPDEVVAVGAAVQAGVLKGEVKDLLLLDVTPLSLGIETLGGVMTKIIERNTTIPIRKSQVFSTAEDGQTSVEVHVLQGEREMASGNRTLGKFHLQGIPPAPRGVPQIEVTFDIDANGIVHVAAKDTATGKETKIQIERGSSTGLSKDEVERSVKEASAHAEEDKKRRELVDARNNLDTQVYGAEKFLKENREKIPVGELKPLEDSLDKAKVALKSENLAEIKKSVETLQTALFKVTETLYKKTGGAPNAAGDGKPEGEAKKKDGDVIEAEFEEGDSDSKS